MIKKIVLKGSFVLALLALASCSKNQGISNINVGTHGNNELKIQIDVTTNDDVQVYAEYWSDKRGIKSKITTPVSKSGLKHSLVLCNIIPETLYKYQLSTVSGNKKSQVKFIHLNPENFRNGFKNNLKPTVLNRNYCRKTSKKVLCFWPKEKHPEQLI